MQTSIYNIQGKVTSTIELPENIFGLAWNDSLMHQVVTSMMDNARTPTAHVKDRGAVRGGGKKPWKQKGTGRARHGSIRSPIWKGGGVTHGPSNEKNYARAIPKKMRAKALFVALSRKLKDGQLIFIDSFGLTDPKTSLAMKSLTAISKVEGFDKLVSKKANAALVSLAEPTSATLKSFSNIGSIYGGAVRDLNPALVMKYKYLIIENAEAAIAILSARATKKTTKATDEAKKEKKANKVVKVVKTVKKASKKVVKKIK